MSQLPSSCPHCGAELGPAAPQKEGVLTCSACGAEVTSGREGGADPFAPGAPPAAFVLETDEDHEGPDREPERARAMVDVFEIQDAPQLRKRLIEEYFRSRDLPERRWTRLLPVALAVAAALGAGLALLLAR